jgi:transcription antitermination factor NusG
MRLLNLIRHKQKFPFQIGDKVYMDSPFGRYKGQVKDINLETKQIEVEYSTPNGAGTTWAWFGPSSWKKQS